jgi:dTMP kinase
MAVGKFIALEGVDGSGLTTQVDLLKRDLDKQGWMSYLTKEPTDGPAGAIIRLVLRHRLLAAKNRMTSSRSRSDSDGQQLEGLNPATVALLFAADRMDHLTGDIIPMLEKGVTVVSDRYWLSSFAYQTASNLELNWIREINSKAIRPDLTLFFDVPVEIARKRIDANRWHAELYETLEKMEEVRANYLACIKVLQAEGHKIIPVDATPPIDIVHKKVWRIIKVLLSGNSIDSFITGQLELIGNRNTDAGG